MRTTIEIEDEHRARLMELAARRGEKGFSSIVGEAITRYLDELSAADERVEVGRAARGSLSARDADGLRARTTELREHWR